MDPLDLSTTRLRLRRLDPERDTRFIVALLNDPGWLEFIGDRKVRTLDDARAYIVEGPCALYDERSFGLLLVEERASATSVGICGLLTRDGLDAPDLGFAFLHAHCGKGLSLIHI